MSKTKEAVLKPPFRLADSASYIAMPAIALERLHAAWYVVAWSVPRECVAEYTVHDHEIGDGLRFNVVTPASEGVQGDITPTHLQSLRRKALDFGATPGAIRLLHAHKAFTTKELEMASEKLAKKGAKLPIKEAKVKPVKEAADPKPKGNPKGNPAGLEKARAARDSKKADLLKDKRKIALTDKGKEKIAKGGESSAVLNLKAMRDAKTVGAAIEGGLGLGDINYAEKSGTITVG